jgi:hypothetical protein
MTPRVRWCRRAVLLLLVLAGTTQVACVTPLTGGSIDPSTFHFTNTVPHDGLGTGDWKVAQVNIMLARLSGALPEGVWCDVEVGVPEVNIDGPVLDASARIESAVAANMAAQSTLQERWPTALLCQGFRKQMDKNLKVPIKGSRVTAFQTLGVPRTRHPAEE